MVMQWKVMHYPQVCCTSVEGAPLILVHQVTVATPLPGGLPQVTQQPLGLGGPCPAGSLIAAALTLVLQHMIRADYSGCPSQYSFCHLAPMVIRTIHSFVKALYAYALVRR